MREITTSPSINKNNGTYNIEEHYGRKKREASRISVVVPEWSKSVNVFHCRKKTVIRFHGELFRGVGVPDFRTHEVTIAPKKSIKSRMMGTRKLDYTLVPFSGRKDPLSMSIKYHSNMASRFAGGCWGCMTTSPDGSTPAMIYPIISC